MGRSPKKGVDYFSHDTGASNGPTLFTVESRFGNDGYAFWFKLLEFLGTQEGLSISVDDRANWLYFVAKARVTEDVANEILNVLADTGAIDKELWNNHIIWSDNFVNRLSDVYRKRGTGTPQKPHICGRNEETENVPAPEAAEKPKTGRGKRPKTTDSSPEKSKYAEYVRMLPSEYESLCARVGKKATDKCIEVLDNYKGSKGKTYKDDYRAILSWVLEKVQKEYPALIERDEPSPSEEGGNPFGEYM